MQKKYAWNRDWLYKPSFEAADVQCTACADGFEPVELPHTNRMLPLNCFSEQEYQFVSCYKKIFALPDEAHGRCIFADFEGVMLACRVYCNGQLAGSHEGGYTPFSVDLTPFVRPEKENVLVVEVDSTERPDIPPFGKVVDYLTYGGIYREVSLRVADALRIEKMWLSCQNPCAKEVSLACRCDLVSPAPVSAHLTWELIDAQENPVACAQQEVQLAAGANTVSGSLDAIQGIHLWSVEDPCLYTVRVRLEAGDICELHTQRYGFRSARFETDGFYLNGQKLRLVGLNRHQSWPYVGYAMPERVQRRDAEIIRRELGCNIVRTSHYPQSRHFLDACDELGLLVIEEIPGWQHVGNAAWKEHSFQDVRDMITRDYNRPSIILWGVRINESQDDHDFYTQTNQIAHEMDPLRQTGGIRYIQRSEFLEDVYTYNDFTHNGTNPAFRPQRESTGLDHDVPTLVTESNGHMYPTKAFDHEDRAVEHALRHLRVIDASLGREDLVGGLSWCAFDYNTHGCFGSGDKICYHGVLDMFRNPKYAAYAYSSQKSPDDEAVLEAITTASRGERDGGGTVPFTILTNCDFVRVYKNGRLVGDFYPDAEKFPHLKHPPVEITHLMEADLDFGLPAEETQEFRAFLAEKVRTGTLITPSAEDFQYIGALAAKHQLDLRQLYGMAVRAAGGWGDAENDLVLEGYVGENRVIVRRIGEHKAFERLAVCPDADTLRSDADSYDATRVCVTALDNLGGRMPYIQECVRVTIDGPARLLGPDMFPLSAGTSAFWIATTGKPGTVTIHVQGMRGKAECQITVL